MTRADTHLDAMLRHLGAAYYDSLHGRAAPSDVKRAVSQVAGEMGERSGTAGASAPHPRAGGGDHRLPGHHGRWHSRVADVMTRQVVTIDRITPYKDIAVLLVKHQINAIPVLSLGRHVAGVVSEADLIAARDTRAGMRKSWTGLPRYGSDRARFARLTAGQLMTSPAITIRPDASISAAAATMTSRDVKLLPVVDASGTLLGVVSRRDLLNVLLVPDDEIARQVREIIAQALESRPEPIKVTVNGGIVTLAGRLGLDIPHGAAGAVVERIWDLDGVVDVINHMVGPEPS